MDKTPVSEPAVIVVTQRQDAVDVYPQTYRTAEVLGSPRNKKSLLDAYILGFPLGFLGTHHFYLGRPLWGLAYLCTFGFFGLGWVLDWFRMPCLVAEVNRRRSEVNPPPKRLLSDAYITWFPPLGIIGLHHYYLGRPLWGIAYTFSLGFFGIGWIVDGFRLSCLVQSVNKDLEMKHQNSIQSEPEPPKPKNLCEAYVVGITPLGILGGHHFYLRNGGFGVMYLFTLGLLGIGWIVDWFRMPVLVKRANMKIQEGCDDHVKHLDTAYLLTFPMGFFGFHHFYLGRYCWGLIYMFTFGVLGIGVIVDLFRLPCLVREVNEMRMKTVEVQENAAVAPDSSLHSIHSSEFGGSLGPAYPAQSETGAAQPVSTDVLPTSPPSYEIATSSVDQPPPYTNSEKPGLSYVSVHPNPPKNPNAI